jgi:hypothetical protein
MSTVAFNGTYSLSTVQNAFYSLPDLAQVLTPDGERAASSERRPSGVRALSRIGRTRFAGAGERVPSQEPD